MLARLLCVWLALAPIAALAEDKTAARKIVLIAGQKSHGPGAHDYERTMRLFKVMFDNSNIAERVAVEVHENGWPEDERVLDDASAVVFYSDGRDGDKYSDAPFVKPERMKKMERLAERGCGLMTMHFSTFVNDQQGERVLDWIGGYFDWEDDDGKRNWYSKISQVETLELADRQHPIARGVPRMSQLRDEVYWKLRFRPNDQRWTPIWRAIDVFDDQAGPNANAVAWAIERSDGGRGFGTSVGHAYRLWEEPGVRKLFLNAMAWIAQVEIPESGVEAAFYPDEQVEEALSDARGTSRAVVAPPMRVLAFTGNKAHAWHNGAASTERVKAALQADRRIQVEVRSDMNELATLPLSDYAAIVLNNYANWHDPQGLSPAAQTAFLEYLRAGGGLLVVHFANGAFHFSLPEAGASDWPEYRRIVRRVWDHHGRQGAKSGHDAFGPFEVRLTEASHPITTGLRPFTVTDELYYHQAGDEPIEPLIVAKSKHTNRDEPLAWAYEYERARVFQTLLGHSEKTYDTYETREMLRRAVAWVAKRKVISLPVEKEKLARVEWPAEQPPAVAPKPNHWGIEGVGFQWREEDSRDDRWKQTEIGDFLASSLPLGAAAGTVAKGLSIRLGEARQANVCYDTATGKLRAAWTGGFLKFTPARFGLILPPLIDGEPQFLSAEGPAWEAKQIQYLGMKRLGERVLLRYLVDGAVVEESPTVQTIGDQPIFVRQFELAATEQPWRLQVAETLEKGEMIELREIHGQQVGLLRSGGRTILFATATNDAQWSIAEQRRLCLTIPPRAAPREVSLAFAACDDAEVVDRAAQAMELPLVSLAKLKECETKSQWTEEIVTRGALAQDDAPYVIDTLTIPFDNPYRALFFTSGHDAVSADTMAVCTVHGDVWLVHGVDAELKQLRWKRFATGLFQPLGLVAKPDGVYVLGRDQITRLRDENGDGEADSYECFSNRFPTSPGGHDYTTCLETDASGNFYFITAQQGVWRLSADGQTLEHLASGLRNPNGLGVGPGPVITAAPQEGNWTPASYIAEIKPGDYFGFGGPKIAPERPLGWTQPLCFIPRRRDNSSGGQVWATSDRFGPLAGQLLHFSYGQCRPLLVLREVIAGQPQGGTVDLPLLFESGAMRGRFHPHDGQLYVSGLRGWTTAATRDGCLQRVRYTGLPAYLPLKLRTYGNGIAITFSETLDKFAAQDTRNYHLEQWNYRYSEGYGSPDIKPSDHRQEGHDELRVESATLLEDGRTVFLEIGDLRPVHQLAIGYTLQAANGVDFRHTVAYTIHQLGAERMDPAMLHRPRDARLLTEEEETSLKPGLLAIFEQNAERDAIPLRMAAFYVAEDEPATRFVSPGPFRVELRGYLRTALKSDVRLSLAGQGDAELEINGRDVLRASGQWDESAPAPIALPGGYSPFVLRYASPTTPNSAAARFRLYWEGPDFAREPVPPTVFFYRADDQVLRTSQQLRRGAELAESRRCAACHAGHLQPPHQQRIALPVGKQSPLRAAWVANYLVRPRQLQAQALMPGMCLPEEGKQRQAAADIASWLSGMSEEPADDSSAATTKEELQARGMTLYEQLNCLSCHGFAEPGEADERHRWSLRFVSAKYTPAGLRRALTAGHREFSLRLSEDEVSSLAAYLEDRATALAPKFPELAMARPERGQAHFVALRCNGCHTIEAPGWVEIQPASLPEKNRRRGCLAEDRAACGNAPDFAFDLEERQALEAFQQHPHRARRGAPLYEQAQLLMERLRCGACHNRDGHNAARLAIFSEESETGRLPEPLPDLTWAGEKLQTTWLQHQLAGDQQIATRPWLASRMPAYPRQAEILSRALAAEHGLVPSDDSPVAPRLELAAQGERLTRKEHLDCRQCHGIGPLEPTGDEKTRLAPGINFANIGERLRPEYYRRFVLDPTRADPTTRMVRLAADGNKTKVTAIYEGDARLQFEALWNFIQTVERPKRKTIAEPR